MLFKTVLFGGFLVAAVCATTMGTDNPKMATLEILPNFDQGLTYKDFRVHYSGVSEGFQGSSVSIKIYKTGVAQAVHEFEVEASQFSIQKAYYFGLNTATEGKYEVDVCAGTTCSGKNPALTSLEDKPQSEKIICEMGHEDASENYVKDKDIKFDVIGSEGWISENDINSMSETIRAKTEWVKNNIKSNPSYDASEKRVYAGVMFDIAYYRNLFMKKDAPNRKSSEFAPDFCKRKYLLSYHIHILNKGTREVMHRFKRTLHMSQTGKSYFIYTNDAETKDARRKVHVELTSDNLNLDTSKTYEIWVSFCATEKDTNESTVCSNPEVADLNVSSA